MKKVIKGKTYNTNTAYLYHRLRTEEKSFGEVKVKDIRTIYTTRTGNYFIHNIHHRINTKNPIMNGTEEWITPISKEEAFRF